MRDRMPVDPDVEAGVTRALGVLGYALVLALSLVVLGAGAGGAMLVYRAIAG